jgi:hypothetical protein
MIEVVWTDPLIKVEKVAASPIFAQFHHVTNVASTFE